MKRIIAKTCTFLLLLIAVAGPAAAAPTEKEKDDSPGFLSRFLKTDSASPKLTVLLDEGQLLQNAYDRLFPLVKQNNPAAPGLEEFTKDKLRILKKEPIYIGAQNLWMVKMGMTGLPQSEEGDAESFEMEMVVDPSGTYQYSEIMDIKTNKSMFLSARKAMNRKEVPAGTGTLITTGQGKENVLFISDPFCPYCRIEFSYLKENLNKIGELRLLHFPMPALHPTAEITCAFMNFAQETVSADLFLQIVSFAYSELAVPNEIKPRDSEKPSIQAIQNMEMQTLEQLLTKFPQVRGEQTTEAFYYLLKGKYVTKVKAEAESISSLLRVKGTPVTVIDGYPIRGFNKPAINDALGIQ